MKTKDTSIYTVRGRYRVKEGGTGDLAEVNVQFRVLERGNPSNRAEGPQKKNSQKSQRLIPFARGRVGQMQRGDRDRFLLLPRVKDEGRFLWRTGVHAGEPGKFSGQTKTKQCSLTQASSHRNSFSLITGMHWFTASLQAADDVCLQRI